jgi:hypothetical protein
MAHGSARQHPMKMGVRRKRAQSRGYGESGDAMNMAWTAMVASTMVRALSNPNPLVEKVI